MILKQRRFEVPEATVTIENVVNEALTEKQQEDRGPWWCSLKLERATVCLGSPLAARARSR